MSALCPIKRSQPKVLVLGASAEYVPFLDKLMDEGLSVVCFDKNIALPNDYIAQHQDQLTCYPIDFSDTQKVIEIVAKEHISHSIALPVGRALVHLGTINEQCHIAGPSFKAIDTLTDKNKFHEFCSQYKLNDCPYVLLEDCSLEQRKAKLDLIEKTLGYPMIIKPTYGSGSLGAALINNRQELLAYQAPERFINDTLLVEKYIDGTEYNINTFVDDKGGAYFSSLPKRYY